MYKKSPAEQPRIRDHRVEVAEKKRIKMRARLMEATMRVHSRTSGGSPVIEDVVLEAKVSRGTFYKYFESLDQALVAIGQALSDQMTTEILPVFTILKEPWQSIAVGFRLFLTRAMLDHNWAGYVTRMDVWPHDSLVAKYMSEDLKNGKARGQVFFDDLDCATDFLMGATAGGIQAVRQGVANPEAYIDASVRMALRSLGCTADRCEEGVAFSSYHIKAWINGELSADVPLWANHMQLDHVSAASDDANGDFREKPHQEIKT